MRVWVFLRSLSRRFRSLWHEMGYRRIGRPNQLQLAPTSPRTQQSQRQQSRALFFDLNRHRRKHRSKIYTPLLDVRRLAGAPLFASLFHAKGGVVEFPPSFSASLSHQTRQNIIRNHRRKHTWDRTVCRGSPFVALKLRCCHRNYAALCQSGHLLLERYSEPRTQGKPNDRRRPRQLP